MSVTIDMTKAREIWRNKIRAARAEEFKQLDMQYMRADETGDVAAKTLIAARKNLLRDAPNNSAIESATTVEELSAVWPFE
jgi:hypothetical protein